MSDTQSFILNIIYIGPQIMQLAIIESQTHNVVLKMVIYVYDMILITQIKPSCEIKLSKLHYYYGADCRIWVIISDN